MVPSSSESFRVPKSHSENFGAVPKASERFPVFQSRSKDLGVVPSASEPFRRLRSRSEGFREVPSPSKPLRRLRSRPEAHPPATGLASPRSHRRPAGRSPGGGWKDVSGCLLHSDRAPHPGMDAALEFVQPGSEVLKLDGRPRRQQNWCGRVALGRRGQSNVQRGDESPAKVSYLCIRVGSAAPVRHANRLAFVHRQVRRFSPPGRMPDEGPVRRDRKR